MGTWWDHQMVIVFLWAWLCRGIDTSRRRTFANFPLDRYPTVDSTRPLSIWGGFRDGCGCQSDASECAARARGRTTTRRAATRRRAQHPRRHRRSERASSDTWTAYERCSTSGHRPPHEGLLGEAARRNSRTREVRYRLEESRNRGDSSKVSRADSDTTPSPHEPGRAPCREPADESVLGEAASREDSGIEGSRFEVAVGPRYLLRSVERLGRSATVTMSSRPRPSRKSVTFTR
jgi:hypothetical protein